MGKDNPTTTGGGRSVFHDIASPREARDLEQRAHVLMGIQEHIKAQGLTQQQIMTATGLHQPDVSYLINGKISRFKIDRLIRIAEALDGVVEVKVTFPPA